MHLRKMNVEVKKKYITPRISHIDMQSKLKHYPASLNLHIKH